MWLTVGILVVRYVALPLIGIGVVKAAHHFGMVGSDTLYQFVLMLQFALPPAMSIGTITFFLIIHYPLSSFLETFLGF